MKRKMNWSLQWSRDKRFSSVLRYRSPGSVDIYKHYTSSCSPCSLSSTLEALNLSLGCYWYSILACRQSIRGLPTLHTISANYPNQFPHLYIYITACVSQGNPTILIISQGTNLFSCFQMSLLCKHLWIIHQSFKFRHLSDHLQSKVSILDVILTSKFTCAATSFSVILHFPQSPGLQSTDNDRFIRNTA